MSSSSLASPSAGAPPAPAWKFLVQALVWNLVLFAVLRLAWIDEYFVGALVEFQKALVFWYGTTPNAGIVVNSSCSGADVMALCAGMTLAYPVAPGRRLAGAALGIGVILALNAARIASLYAVAATPDTLHLLHVYVWPAVLTAATVLYVYLWMRSSERRTVAFDRQWTRFGLFAAGGLLVYAAAAPWVLASRTVYQAGVLTATAGGAVLAGFGVTAHATGNVLTTTRGAFQVTQECLFTPVLPLYLAAVAAFPLRRRGLWLLAAVPLFFVSGVARLLLLALPPVVAASPVVLAHGFYQLLTGAAAIVVAAHAVGPHTSAWRASGRALAALAIAIAGAMATVSLWEPALLWTARLARVVAPSTITSLVVAGDPQGALALLPAFQIGLAAGLWWAVSRPREPRRLALAIGAIALSQVLLLIGLGAVTAWLGVDAHALVVRGWALAVPIGVALLLFAPGATRAGDATYARFWHDVGETFPTLTGAPSTTYYFENEQRLIAEALPSLAGCTLLKTDLWDEAKNTRIMQWAADQGARVYGIDLSEPIVRQARAAFERQPLRPVVSDVRRLPFGDASFDAIYSMGTVEHFAETTESVVELARILKPGGRLILGVPNRHDPFLRPLMVAVLHGLGLYGYGYEKSYSRRQLRAMLEHAGLTATLDSGLLFMPGWLRMLDLWCHTRMRPLTAITRALLVPFVWIDRHVPAARRHGYLIASVGEKPGAPIERATAGATAGFTWRLPPTETAPAGGTSTGIEYAVDARRCAPEALTSLARLQSLFADVLAELTLHPVAPPVWHVFPGEGGVTGMVLLSESHLTIHTYPEAGLAAINLYCCRAEVEWPWDEQLRARLGAAEVAVRVLRRG